MNSADWIAARARFVARLRADLKDLEGLPDSHPCLTVLVGSKAFAEQVKLDLTPREQARVKIAWLLPG